MHITPANSNDLPDLARFASHTFKDTFGRLYSKSALDYHLQRTCSVAYFQQQLARDDVWVDVIKQDENIIAYAKYGALDLPVEKPIVPHMEVHRLYVDPKQKGRGLGKMLMLHMEEHARAEQVEAMYLGVDSKNLSAQGFYEKFGFKKIGEYDYFVGDKNTPGADVFVDREHIMEKCMKRG
jgi:ribosomal protein S18 acetylase RimI-like enzyme